MKFKLLLALAVMAVAVAAVSAQTTTNLVVTPTSPVFDSNHVTGVSGDYAPGFALGSFASDGIAKTDMYFPPTALFGRDVTIGEVASMSYWTKKSTTHNPDVVDWSMIIYTKPYAGDVSTPSWYGDRIGTEPYYSINLIDPANTWNQWSTDGFVNRMRFYESTAGAPGATFGTYSDPDWATFKSGNALSGQPYASHAILFFSIQTGSCCAAGFFGKVDGVRILLTDGSVANINFEATNQIVTTKDQCKSNGWMTRTRADFSVFKNQGDCIQYVNTGK